MLSRSLWRSLFWPFPVSCCVLCSVSYSLSFPFHILFQLCFVSCLCSIPWYIYVPFASAFMFRFLVHLCPVWLLNHSSFVDAFMLRLPMQSLSLRRYICDPFAGTISRPLGVLTFALLPAVFSFPFTIAHSVMHHVSFPVQIHVWIPVQVRVWIPVLLPASIGFPFPNADVYPCLYLRL